MSHHTLLLSYIHKIKLLLITHICYHITEADAHFHHHIISWLTLHQCTLYLDPKSCWWHKIKPRSSSIIYSSKLHKQNSKTFTIPSSTVVMARGWRAANDDGDGERLMAARHGTTHYTRNWWSFRPACLPCHTPLLPSPSLLMWSNRLPLYVHASPSFTDSSKAIEK